MIPEPIGIEPPEEEVAQRSLLRWRQVRDNQRGLAACGVHGHPAIARKIDLRPKVVVLNAGDEDKLKPGTKSIILLTDGSRHYSKINPATLKRRIIDFSGTGS